MPRTLIVYTNKKDSLRDAFNTVYCITRNCGSMTENDHARTLLAEAGEAMKTLYERQLSSSAGKGKKASTAEDVCLLLIGSGYQEFLEIREIILSRTGENGRPIPTLD